MSMYNLQLTMSAGARIPTQEECIELQKQLIALPILDGAREIILTQKQEGKHVEVFKILLPKQEGKG